MPQQQCPWCGHLGEGYEESTPWPEQSRPHDDGSECVCRHVTADTRMAALRDGGRYWDGRAWVCPWCGTAPPASEEETAILEAERDALWEAEQGASYHN